MWFSWKLYLILNQNGKNVHRPVFVPERLKNHIYGAPYTSMTYLLEYPFSTNDNDTIFSTSWQDSETVTISFQQLAYINLVI